MSRLEQLLAGVLALIALLVSGWLTVEHYGAERYQAGYSAAVAAGKEQHDRDAAAAHQTESDLRSQLAARDADAFKKDQEYAANLETAQRRMRAGADRLRCPASAVQPTATPGDRPAAAEPAADGEGLDIVPEAAAAILGDAADIAGLVRRYQQVVDRFEACRVLNSK